MLKRYIFNTCVKNATVSVKMVIGFNIPNNKHVDVLTALRIFSACDIIYFQRV